MSATLYSVLIVNYNSALFVKKAVESVLATATTENYTVQIVDNGSSDFDREKLREIRHPKVSILELPINRGFAIGYNTAARLAFERDAPSYFVIMNPDIELIQPGTIECLIDQIRRADHRVIGAQPIIWDFRFFSEDQARLGIRRVPDYWDLLICENVLLRLIFRNRFRRFMMADAQPYDLNLTFEVPSGAFFVIDAQIFMDIGGFDENTFLYGEEFILGKKLRDRNLSFLLVPTLKVRHYQGASTGFEYRGVSRRMYSYRLRSHIYYARQYLGAGSLKTLVLRIISEIGFAIRVVAWFLRFVMNFFGTCIRKRVY
jgi:GT2 family glycosyltransferase